MTLTFPGIPCSLLCPHIIKHTLWQTRIQYYYTAHSAIFLEVCSQAGCTWSLLFMSCIVIFVIVSSCSHSLLKSYLHFHQFVNQTSHTSGSSAIFSGGAFVHSGLSFSFPVRRRRDGISFVQIDLLSNTLGSRVRSIEVRDFPRDGRPFQLSLNALAAELLLALVPFHKFVYKAKMRLNYYVQSPRSHKTVGLWKAHTTTCHDLGDTYGCRS